MIVLDTHIWVRWVHADPQLPAAYQALLRHRESLGLGVSAISCWGGGQWCNTGVSRCRAPSPKGSIRRTLAYPGLRLTDLTPQIAVKSTQLPGVLHPDPADQIIVATARVHDCPIVTLDARILAGFRVQKLP